MHTLGPHQTESQNVPAVAKGSQRLSVPTNIVFASREVNLNNIQVLYHDQDGVFSKTNVIKLPPHVQQFIKDILHTMIGRWCFASLNDILSYTKTPEAVFKSLLAHLLFCKLEKCAFYQCSTPFLGFKVLSFYLPSQSGMNLDAVHNLHSNCYSFFWSLQTSTSILFWASVQLQHHSLALPNHPGHYSLATPKLSKPSYTSATCSRLLKSSSIQILPIYSLWRWMPPMWS